jgi:hypothetical protein
MLNNNLFKNNKLLFILDRLRESLNLRATIAE